MPARSGDFLTRTLDLPLETVILLIGGMALAIAGALLFPIASGALPYYEDGLFGLLLVVFALQTITMGKTPFGDMRRSKALVAAGVVLACFGIVTCVIPGKLGSLPRIVLFLCFGLGGAVQLLRTILDKDKAPLWMKLGGIFRLLLAACCVVYALSMVAGLLLLLRPSLPIPVTAAVMLLFGLSVIFLGLILSRVYKAFPEADSTPGEQPGFSFTHSMLLLVGVFMMLLGLLLIPVSRGLLPFSSSAQLGLLMIIFAVQALAAGNTPIGPFPRNPLVVGCGFVFAALGIVSCVVPGKLVVLLTRLVGALNIAGGLVPLTGRVLSRSGKAGGGAPIHPLQRRLSRTTITLNLLSMMFGTSMLLPGIIPGLVIGIILAANGGVLLYLLRLLIAVAVLSGAGEEAG
ncbi:MAG: hypothetical protein HPY75_13975 [Actinobacteria bacterium]|nr:hypothetical protein [Actinomycetota bacterium]